MGDSEWYRSALDQRLQCMARRCFTCCTASKITTVPSCHSRTRLAPCGMCAYWHLSGTLISTLTGAMCNAVAHAPCACNTVRRPQANAAQPPRCVGVSQCTGKAFRHRGVARGRRSGIDGGGDHQCPSGWRPSEHQHHPVAHRRTRCNHLR